MTSPESTSESRLRLSPDLIRAAGKAAAASAIPERLEDVRPPAPSAPSSPLRGKLLKRTGDAGSVERDTTMALGDVLPGLDGTAKGVVSLLDGKAQLVVGADVRRGAWHYSAGTIDKFRRDKVSTGGKFGPGTYLGIGTLAGETVDGLKSSGAVKHDVGFRGNVMVLSREDVLPIAGSLRAQKGMPESRITSSIANAPLTSYLEGMDFGGTQVDAVMVYMDPERTSAEMAILPHATEQLEVLGMGSA